MEGKKFYEVNTFSSFISSRVFFYLFIYLFFFINPQFVKAKLRRRGEIHFRLQTWKGKLHCHFSKDTREGVLNFMCGQKGRAVTGASGTDSYIWRILKEMYPCDYFDPTWGLWTKPFSNFHDMALECIFVLGLLPPPPPPRVTSVSDFSDIGPSLEELNKYEGGLSPAGGITYGSDGDVRTRPPK